MVVKWKLHRLAEGREAVLFFSEVTWKPKVDADFKSHCI